MAKDVQKCVRLSQRAAKYIDGYRGDNFSQKLENLTSDMEERHDQMVLDWNRLQAQIDDKHAEMVRVQEHLRKVRTVEARFGPLVDELMKLLPME